MANFLDDTIDGIGQAVGTAANVANNNDFNQNGFVVPPLPSADGNGLPSSKVKSNRTATNIRSMVHWFVPEFGVVKMYINPKQIRYAHKKLINQERTKGGYNLQYFGEQLSTLSISGTTGSSGVEGINVLYEIYRAEQYAFDAVGLTLAADNANNGASNQIISGIANAVGGSVGTTIAGSLFGTDPSSQALAARNIPSLAQYAFGVEMFFQGWIFRGYFDSMNINESADNLGMFDYDLTFFVTERRGYRTNGYSWQRSAVDGPSGDHIPLSFSDIKG